MNTDHIGSTLDSFLEEEGILEEVTTDATLQVLAWQIRNDLWSKRLAQSELARIMGTSRSQVSRLMRADGADIKVSTLEKAARALDRTLKIELI
jgi:DNA-binding Xre family transcriptional regulator